MRKKVRVHVCGDTLDVLEVSRIDNTQKVIDLSENFDFWVVSCFFVLKFKPLKRDQE